MNDKRALVLIGATTFLLVLAAGGFVQFVLLPTIFPTAHLGHGLFSPDAYGFHITAASTAAAIHEHGWGVWQLRPNGSSPAGISSIFYAVLVAEPYVVLPLNAAVHALSGVTAFLLLRQFFGGPAAFWGAFIFLANPAALEWATQIHRDGYFVLGNLAFLLGVLRLAIPPAHQPRHTWTARPAMLLILGGCCTWIARPYWVQIELLVLLACCAVFAASWWRNGTPASVGSLVVLLATISALYLLASQAEAYSISGQEYAYRAGERGTNPTQPQITEETQAAATWRLTAHVPAFIERKAVQIATARDGAISIGGGSTIDTEVRFMSVPDILLYLPRALTIGLFSPFPDIWVGEGRTPLMTLARAVIGFVTLLCYVGLVGLAAWLATAEYRLKKAVTLFYATSSILLFSLSTPNIGTLIRYRYGFYMLLVALGYAFLLQYFWNRREQARPPTG